MKTELQFQNLKWTFKTFVYVLLYNLKFVELGIMVGNGTSWLIFLNFILINDNLSRP